LKAKFGAFYQQWNNYVAKGMVVESKRKLAANNIFTNVVLSLRTAKYSSL